MILSRSLGGIAFLEIERPKLYFSKGSGQSIAETANNIFLNTLRIFQMEEADQRRQFEELLRSHFRNTAAFNYLPAARGNGPLSHYSKEIQNRVIHPLIPKK